MLKAIKYLTFFAILLVLLGLTVLCWQLGSTQSTVCLAIVSFISAVLMLLSSVDSSLPPHQLNR